MIVHVLDVLEMGIFVIAVCSVLFLLIKSAVLTELFKSAESSSPFPIKLKNGPAHSHMTHGWALGF